MARTRPLTRGGAEVHDPGQCLNHTENRHAQQLRNN